MSAHPCLIRRIWFSPHHSQLSLVKLMSFFQFVSTSRRNCNIIFRVPRLPCPQGTRHFLAVQERWLPIPHTSLHSSRFQQLCSTVVRVSLPHSSFPYRDKNRRVSGDDNQELFQRSKISILSVPFRARSLALSQWFLLDQADRMTDLT